MSTMREMTISAPAADQALRHGAAFLIRPDAGVLCLTGADRADFLHRMTTNEINRLAVGQATVTVLTSPTARILQVFTVMARAEELWLLPAPGATRALAQQLRGQIFFMDQVKVADRSEEVRRLRVMGPKAAQTLGEAGLAVADLADSAWQESTVTHEGTNLTVTVLTQMRYGVPGYELLIPVATFDVLQALLQGAGIVAIDADTYENRRIELGRPAPSHELTEEFNPLEAGIGWTCADNKGCYTGQEIIARQITYDKVTKSLVGLQSDRPLTVGTELQADGRTVGVVTSSGMSPQLAAPVALAIVRRPYHEAGTSLQGDTQIATVVALPFVE